MPSPRTLPFLVVLGLATLAGPTLARAATANCMSADGSCSVSNDGFDWVDCTCADGSGGGGGGGNMWAGLTEMELQPICEDQLAQFCGPFVPPEYLECWSVFGSCMIDNDPEDTISCECIDGTTGGVPGGGAWAGYTDMQLYAECEAQLDVLCVAPPGSIQCANANGECTIDNAPEDFLGCECLDGSGGSFGGGNSWAGLSELELYGECGTQLVGLCGGPLPPPPWVECSSTLGDCMIDNDPEDLLECTCADGETISSSGGSTWAGLSEEELFMECETQLYEGCMVAAESSGTDTGEGTGGTGSGGSSSSGGSTGEPGQDTGSGSSGPFEGSTGTAPPASTGEEPTGGASESSGDGGATDGGSGCSCSSTGGASGAGWALVLLGLVGVGRRRRAARAG